MTIENIDKRDGYLETIIVEMDRVQALLVYNAIGTELSTDKRDPSPDDVDSLRIVRGNIGSQLKKKDTCPACGMLIEEY